MWTLLLAAVTTVNAADLEFPDARFALAVYCQPTCPPELGETVERALSPIASVSSLSATPTRVERVSAVVRVEAYGRPDIGKLRQLGRKLSGAQLDTLGASQEVYVTRVAAPRDEALSAVRKVYGVFAEIEASYDLVLDETPTGRLYTGQEFVAHAAGMTTTPLDTSVSYEVIQTEHEGGGRTLETIGLRTIGLPDFRVEAQSDEVDGLRRVVDLVAQTAFEAGALRTKFKVDAEGLLQADARERAKGIAGKVRLKAVPVSLGSNPDPRYVLSFKGQLPASPEPRAVDDAAIAVPERVSDPSEIQDAVAVSSDTALQDEATPTAETPSASSLGWATVAAAPVEPVSPPDATEPSDGLEALPLELLPEATPEEDTEQVVAVEEPIADAPQPLDALPPSVADVAPLQGEKELGSLNEGAEAQSVVPMGTPGTVLHPPQKRASKAWKALEREHSNAQRTFLGPVKKAYLEGFPEGDELFVKVPFPAGRDRVEYLWLRVDAWNGREIMAELVSLPAWVAQLYPGAKLALIETTVFDYLWRQADGQELGNTTQDRLAVD